MPEQLCVTQLARRASEHLGLAPRRFDVALLQLRDDAPDLRL